MAVRAARLTVALSLAVGIALGTLAPVPARAADRAVAQLDARERALRQEFTRQRYERERRRREQDWQDYRDELRQQQRDQDSRRRESVLGGGCDGQGARVRESLDSALDSARTGAGTGTGSARERLDAMRRSGCDPVEVRRLEQELRETRDALRRSED